MDINEISEDEKAALYKAADEHQTTGIINTACPRCDGKLKYTGNKSSYRIICENKCGIFFTLRGI